MTAVRPSRTTRALGATSAPIACIARSALPSWMKPISALITTTPMITAVSAT
jgi:hypothetical protein